MTHTIKVGSHRAVAFNLAKAISEAWKLQWKQKEEMNDEKRADMQYYRANLYLTASDLEAQVRLFAEEQIAGEKWGSRGPAWGKGYGSSVRISLGRRQTLLDACRDWLLSEQRAGRLSSFNFGRGHISGARYRPAGMEISETEQKTLEAKRKRRETPRPVHAKVRQGGSAIVCMQDRMKGRIRMSRSKTRSSIDPNEITCPRCQKLIDEGALFGERVLCTAFDWEGDEKKSNPIYERYAKLGVGAIIRTSVDAPGIGVIEERITRIDDYQVHGVTVSSTVREMTEGDAR
jgi:hypothetical protein